MRTTLDIDPDVLQAAKELAVAEKQTAGRVISRLAREALARTSTSREIVVENGFPYLKGRGGIVTSELVERLLYEADLDDAGLPRRGT